MRRAVHRLRRWSAPGALILAYHRVADVETDPWGLAVSPAHFAEHLDLIRRHAHPMPLAALVRALEQRRLPRRAVVVTFDDGYADNLHVARPLLARHDVPATVFVTTGKVGQARAFWWDELARLLLQPGELPEALEVKTGGQAHRWDLGKAAVYTGSDQERRGPVWKAPPDTRAGVCHGVYKVLQPMPEPMRDEALAQIAAWAGIGSEEGGSARAMTLDELHALGDGRLIDVGAHSVTHPLLPAQPLEVQRREIQGSREWLERMLGRAVESFAYPHGSYAAATVDLAREAFTCACGARQEAVRRGSDRHRLPRCAVDDWDGDELARRLGGWFRS